MTSPNFEPEYDIEMAKIEADVALVGATLSTSWFKKRLDSVKEPYDMPDKMIGVAYAMFKCLVDAGNGSGREIEWGMFLQEALKDCINDSWEKN